MIDGFAEWPGARAGTAGADGTCEGKAGRGGRTGGGGPEGIGGTARFLGDVDIVSFADAFFVAACGAISAGVEESRFLTFSGSITRFGDDLESGSAGFDALPVLRARSVGSALNGVC